MSMRLITCCFTGHRSIPGSEASGLTRRLYEAVEEKIDDGFFIFAAGGALGFDTMAAQAVLHHNKKNPAVELHLILPCRNQTYRWNPVDISVYDDILKRAHRVIYVRDEYTRSCMFERNRLLVDSSAACICYLSSEGGGTGYTVRYARDKGIPITNLYSRSIE